MFQNYAPTTFNRYISDSLVANKRVRYTIWDTAGTREANSTRTLACREADVFLVCYKIAEPASLFSAINFWVPEVRAQAPSTPVILVGCQSDLRTDRGVVAALAKVGKSPVSSQQGPRHVPADPGRHVRRDVGQDVGPRRVLRHGGRRPHLARPDISRQHWRRDNDCNNQGPVNPVGPYHAAAEQLARSAAANDGHRSTNTPAPILPCSQHTFTDDL